MITLFMDTSNKNVSISIIKDDELLKEKVHESIGNHSGCTVLMIDEILKECYIDKKDINRIVVVNGPGSFTGIRIGLTIAKVMGYALDIPVIPISSLRALALSNQGRVITLIDAKNNNYYYGCYNDGHEEDVEKFVSKEELLNLIRRDYSLISYDDFMIDDYSVKGISYDVMKIVLNVENVTNNVHNIKPNYLKLPQLLEKK